MEKNGRQLKGLNLSLSRSRALCHRIRTRTNQGMSTQMQLKTSGISLTMSQKYAALFLPLSTAVDVTIDSARNVTHLNYPATGRLPWNLP